MTKSTTPPSASAALIDGDAVRDARLRPMMGRRRALGSLAWAAGMIPLESTLGCSSEDADTDGGASATLGATPGGGAAPNGSASGADPGSGAGTEGSPGQLTLQTPPWDDVPTCAASNADGAGQGPFFIHDGEREDDIDLFRQDIRGRYDEAAEPGTEMELHLRVLDARGADCGATPVAGVEVYVWHTDAQGYYSGFGDPGDQTPDEPYAGTPNQNDLNNPNRFCRGAQITDSEGVVSFRSIFPGWYNGRDIHVHVVVLRAGSRARGREVYSDGDHLFTTQFYFDSDLSERVHRASEPYLRRTQLSAYAGAILADEPNNSGLRAKASFDGRRVVAQIQILLDPS
jgi:protocatechuate 3,4-dioxygenase beta subunit